MDEKLNLEHRTLKYKGIITFCVGISLFLCFFSFFRSFIEVVVISYSYYGYKLIVPGLKHIIIFCTSFFLLILFLASVLRSVKGKKVKFLMTAFFIGELLLYIYSCYSTINLFFIDERTIGLISILQIMVNAGGAVICALAAIYEWKQAPKNTFAILFAIARLIFALLSLVVICVRYEQIFENGLFLVTFFDLLSFAKEFFMAVALLIFCCVKKDSKRIYNYEKQMNGMTGRMTGEGSMAR